MVQAALEARARRRRPRISEVHITLQTGLTPWQEIRRSGTRTTGKRRTTASLIPRLALMYGTVNHHHFDDRYLHDKALLDW